MSIISLLLIILVIGVLVWAVNAFGASYIDGKFLQLFNIIAIVATILWLVFTVFGASLPNMTVGHIGR